MKLYSRSLSSHKSISCIHLFVFQVVLQLTNIIRHNKTSVSIDCHGKSILLITSNKAFYGTMLWNRAIVPKPTSFVGTCRYGMPCHQWYEMCGPNMWNIGPLTPRIFAIFRTRSQCPPYAPYSAELRCFSAQAIYELHEHWAFLMCLTNPMFSDSNKYCTCMLLLRGKRDRIPNRLTHTARHAKLNDECWLVALSASV